ncbi:tetracycline resistance [Apiospora saccharicola]
MTTPCVAIIGAGPAGLALARLLEVRGISYIVYERDASPSVFNRTGGTLDIHASTGQRAIAAGGLSKEFERYARYDASTFKLWDGVGKGKQYVDLERGAEFPEIDRGDLRKIYLEAVPEEKIKWGHGLKRVTRGVDGEAPTLEFADGTTASGFRLVVGADGAWSKVRSLLSPATPQYCGIHIIESRINPDNPVYARMQARVRKGMLLAGGPNRTAIFQNLGDGSYRLYLGVQVPEDYARGDLHRPRHRLPTLALIPHPPSSISWDPVPGVTLIGDAAHLGPPSGEGANYAMTDALYLTDKLAEHSGFESDEARDRAVREYEVDMFERGAGLVQRGLDMLACFYADNSPLSIVDMFKEKGAPITETEI